MPKTGRPRTKPQNTKRPRNRNKNKLNIASWYKQCEICDEVVVAPNSTGMWLHFKRFHPELNRGLIVPQPQVPNRDAYASKSSGNVGKKNQQRKHVPGKSRKNLWQPKRKLYHQIEEGKPNDGIVHTKINRTSQTMGSCIQPQVLPKGELIYRKQPARLRLPRFRKYLNSGKTHFDDDGIPYTLDQDEREMEDDCTDEKPDTEWAQDSPTGTPRIRHVKSQDTSLDDEGSKLAEAASIPLPCDAEDSNDDENKEVKVEKFSESAVSQQVESTKHRKRSKRDSKFENVPDTSGMPIELRDDPKMHKYWRKRHSLFVKYDEGIKLDRESWFSVTPEKIAREIANKCVYDVVLDAFCGAGGNTIQFAHTSKKVIAVDIDPQKISMAKHNATVYGVANRIEFIVGDFFQLAPTLKADMVFLSPPWGGPNYTDSHEYDLETMLEPKPASELMRVARTISSTIAFYLPRNSRPDQILSLATQVGGSVQIERNFLNKGFAAITAYYTKQIVDPSECDK